MQRFDLYTRGTLYSMVCAGPLLAALLASIGNGARPWQVAAFVAVSMVHAALAVVVLHGGFEWYLGRRGRWPVKASAALVAVSVAGVAVAAAVFGTDSPAASDSGRVTALALVLFAGFLGVAFTPRLTTPWLLLAALLATAVVGAAALAAGWPVRNAGAVTWSALLAFTCGWLGSRASVWMLGIVSELDRSRQAQAQLAVAEERLRFSRDLHDVVGRNLSVIALKSELAAALAQRGRPEAGAEMTAVRDIAQESLREVREVARGYREVDLRAELGGARSVLRSAGVSTRVVGDGDRLPPDVQSVLGWVVREGTTNVLRHSAATSCVITVTDEPGAVTLTMENDGVAAGHASGAGGAADDGGVGGSGLAGLTERLLGAGGELSATHLDGGRFRLTARIPGKAPARAGEAPAEARPEADEVSPADRAHSARISPVIDGVWVGTGRTGSAAKRSRTASDEIRT